MTARRHFPSGCDIRISTAPGGTGWCVLVAAPPLKADPTTFLRRGSVSAALTHDAGTTWPDRSGLALASAILEQGGMVSLTFSSLSDALVCESRLRREVAA